MALGAIPGAQLQFEVIAHILQQWCPEPRRVLDLGCGDGILTSFLLSEFPQPEAVLVDFSEPMLKAARQRLGNTEKATFVHSDFSTADWVEKLPVPPEYEVVVSGFAIHHQPDDRKRELYHEIHQLLSPGGVFLNLEHVSSTTPVAEALSLSTICWSFIQPQANPLTVKRLRTPSTSALIRRKTSWHRWSSRVTGCGNWDSLMWIAS